MSLARIGRFFPRSTVLDTAVTTDFFRAPREDVWRAMMFYEEVPSRPAALLRLVLPLPVRTRGDKMREGARIDCTYEGGSLVKVMTAVDVPRAIAFDVQTQALGIEDAITMTGGSYELTEEEGGTRVAMTTRYFGHLRPRWLFRPLERFLASRLHRHILAGMHALLPEGRAASPAHSAEERAALPAEAPR